ncbi:hypothetical protein PFICI_00264 [Pestalotiopsis fici W106-1]|uniref:DNA mismatch repair protein S5 domain-containing protein n=1 Tax=Pestalotiopsis fici (strain W106-1 / CGMCC3.15140) TaxID=1229662 RepID=W3XMD7_PESFW|nr:uncharacterized protein PFICI_00264 [Pestalotiopsis fici W106-1]ETS86436.1 hypothetical protein PFICI_00264 [Pestalotiopsis fici W106-1]
MPIAALPDETKRLLGSTSTITTPVSLVKELLDNAIDAKATTIEVLVSHDTIDKIEVRDNGSGIHPDDYDCLGRRGYTSKLKTFDDLQRLAGTTLGFRGEALAGANTLGKVCIITKTPSDSVAALLHIRPGDGGVLEQEQVAAPIGTTVRVSQLYHELPVRRQMAVKESKRTIEKIKDLLVSYVMAKPHIKMIFKVYKHANLSWSYSPRRPVTLKEAALQILGKEGASRCAEKTFDGDSPASLKITALVWRPDTEVLRLPKHRYFSVDGRPVTGTAGTMRKLLPIYHKYLESALPSPDEKALNVGDVFLCVNLVNPGPYDVNITPSKDEILFEDEEAILRCFGNFCEQIYGLLKTGGRHETPLLRQSQTLASAKGVETGTNDLEPSIFSSGWTAINTKAPQKGPVQTPVISEGIVSDQAVLSTSMSDDLGERFAAPNDMRKTRPHNIETKRRSPTISREQEGTERGQKEVGFGRGRELESTLNGTPLDVANNQQHYAAPVPGIISALQLANIDTRAFTTTTPEPEIMLHRGAPPRDLDVPPRMRLPSNRSLERDLTDNAADIFAPRSDPNEILSKKRNTSTHRRAQPPWTPPSSVQKSPEQWQDRYTATNHTKRNGTRQSTISFGGYKNPVHSHSKQKGGRCRSKNVAPAREEDRNSFNNVGQDPPSQISHGVYKSSGGDLTQLRMPQGGTHEVTIRNDLTPLHSTELPSIDDLISNNPPIKTSLQMGDPRAYLLRHQKSMEADEERGRPRKLRRTKSLLLPLENIVESDQTRQLTLVIRLSISYISTCVEQLGQFDRYIFEGDIEEALDMDLSEARRIEKSCDGILSSWDGADGDEVKSNLSSVLKGKSVDVTK